MTVPQLYSSKPGPGVRVETTALLTILERASVPPPQASATERCNFPKASQALPTVSLRSRTRVGHSKDLYQHLLCDKLSQGLLSFSIMNTMIRHRDRKNWQMAESMQHPNLTFSRKLLSA